MYYPKIYKDFKRKQIEAEIKKEGFNPIIISNESGYVYSAHQHPETKLLVFLEGSMEVTIDGKTYHCVPGDKCIVPRNMKHSAVVGKDGCVFFWSEKILKEHA